MKCGLVVLGILAIALLIYQWRKRREKIDAIWTGTDASDLIERWSYSPEEWRKFAEDDFRWVKNKDVPGELVISDSSILISNGSDEFYRDLDREWTLTEIEFREKTSIFRIKLRQSKENHSLDRYEYFYEDLWIPIPSGNTEKANRVVERFYENMRVMKENQRGAASGDLLFGQFLNDETAEDKAAKDAENN